MGGVFGTDEMSLDGGPPFGLVGRGWALMRRDAAVRSLIASSGAILRISRRISANARV